MPLLSFVFLGKSLNFLEAPVFSDDDVMATTKIIVIARHRITVGIK